MKTVRMSYHLKLLGLVAMLFFIVHMAGCAPQQQQPSPMEHWRELARENRGYSPQARKRDLAVPDKKIETLSPAGIDKPTARPLPKNKLSMTIHQTETAVLLRALARSVNLNIMINESVKGRISLNVKDAEWDQVFLGVLNSQGLDHEWEGSILRVVTLEDREKKLLNLEADEKILAKRRTLEMQSPMVTKIIPIDFSSAEKLRENLKIILADQKAEESVGAVMVDSHTNSLIVQAPPSDLQRIIRLITELDRPTQQIMIEAHIVETTSRTARELGMQWGGLYYNSSGRYWVTPNAMGALTDATTGAVLDPTAGAVSNFPADLSQAAQEGALFSLGIIGQNSHGILATQLSALEEDGKLNILSSPSITTLDNKEATIESGDQVPTPIIDTDGRPTVEYKDAILSLKVTPHVIQDTTLKLEIVTTKNEVDFTRLVQTYPTIIKKKAETTVILFDGQTTVIGGLKKNTSQNRERGIPGLRHIPLLGYLFKNEGKSDQMEEILIFITPYILKSPPETSAAAPQDAADSAPGTLQ